jgi:hypothetical protein
MSTLYSGVAASGSQAPAIQIQRPADGDAASAASINTALQKIADYIAWLQLHSALVDAANGFSVTQQIATGDLELTNAAIQSILKATGGKLQVGTKTGNASDVDLLVNGVVKATLRASDGKLSLVAQLLAAAGIDAGSQPVVNVANPTNPQDADTKAARDTAIATAAPAASKIIAAGIVSSGGPLNAGAFGFASSTKTGTGAYSLVPNSPPANGIGFATYAGVGTVVARAWYNSGVLYMTTYNPSTGAAVDAGGTASVMLLQGG